MSELGSFDVNNISELKRQHISSKTLKQFHIKY